MKRRGNVKQAIFTIVSNNYVHFARTLMESVRCHEPDVDRYVLVLDEPIAPETCSDSSLYTVLEMGKLSLPSPEKFLFRYTILEANTAVKPWVFEYLSRSLKYGSVIYLDPDTYLYKSLDHIHQQLESGASLVLLPHITSPLWDRKHPGETDILKAGTYNLGFVAIGQWDLAHPIVSWWQERLEHHCVVDREHGLFVDQKWMDLAPGLFDGVIIVRHKGYNAAYWNLHERPLKNIDNEWFAGEQALHFFHFSGIDVHDPSKFSKHQTRFALRDLGDGQRLVLEYCTRLRVNGAAAFDSRPYGFGRSNDGFSISGAVRRLYRDDKVFQEQCGSNPFQADLISLLNVVPFASRGYPHLTRMMRCIWSDHPHLQQAFPDPYASDRCRFVSWFVSEGKSQLGVPDELIEPARTQLDALGRSEHSVCSAGFLSDLTGILDSHDALFLQGAYQLILHRDLDPDGRNHFMDRLRRRTLSRRRLLFELAVSPEARRQGISMLRLLAFSLPLPLLRFLSKSLHARGIAPAAAPPGGTMALSRSYPTSTPSNVHPTGNIAQDTLRIAGYFDAGTGVGESARRCVAAAKCAKLTLEKLRISHEHGISSQVKYSKRITEKTPEEIVTILHVNADQMIVLGNRLDEIDSGQSYRIGYWHWEMPMFPGKYAQAFSYVNEIWVPSNYVLQALLPVSPVPVRKIPHCIGIPSDVVNRQARLDLPGNPFVFLVMYDMRSHQRRKNPLGAISAYLSAFPTVSEAQALIVKVSNAELDPSSFDELIAATTGRPDIRIVTDQMDRQAVYSLQARTDCLISLHRSEGFGLCPAECMFLGKPVIATAWSGNMEFMTARNSYLVDFVLEKLSEPVGPYEAGQYWAEPDPDHATWLLRQVVENDTERQRRAHAAKRTMQNHYSPYAIGRLYRDRLSQLVQSSTSASREPEPCPASLTAPR